MKKPDFDVFYEHIFKQYPKGLKTSHRKIAQLAFKVCLKYIEYLEGKVNKVTERQELISNSYSCHIIRLQSKINDLEAEKDQGILSSTK
jgi:hypothetical protein